MNAIFHLCGELQRALRAAFAIGAASDLQCSAGAKAAAANACTRTRRNPPSGSRAGAGRRRRAATPAAARHRRGPGGLDRRVPGVPAGAAGGAAKEVRLGLSMYLIIPPFLFGRPEVVDSSVVGVSSPRGVGGRRASRGSAAGTVTYVHLRVQNRGNRTHTQDPPPSLRDAAPAAPNCTTQRAP